MSNRNRNRSRSRTGNPAKARAALGANGAFTFTHNGDTYTLPPASDAAGKVKAGQLIDAVMDDTELAQVRLMLAFLLEVGADPKAMQALRDKSTLEFNEVLSNWMKTTGADPGESPRSST